MRNRQYETHLRLNEAEYRKLGELAQKAGVTRSVVLRKLIMGAEIKERPMVDDQRIAFSVGVELSFLNSDLQAALMTAIDLNDCTPSYAQACRMHKAVNDGSISEGMIDKIMAEEKPNQKEQISISADELRGYIPNGTPSKMKAFIRKACEHYSEYLKKKREEVR